MAEAQTVAFDPTATLGFGSRSWAISPHGPRKVLGSGLEVERSHGKHMQRRELITALGGVAIWPLAAHAQQAAKLPIIGFLGPITPSSQREWTDAFVQSIGQHGWIDGRTVAIEYRWGEGRSERLAEYAAEFVRLKVGVIVTAGTAAVIAAKQSTSVIPIAFGTAGGPDWTRVGGRPGARGGYGYR